MCSEYDIVGVRREKVLEECRDKTRRYIAGALHCLGEGCLVEWRDYGTENVREKLKRNVFEQDMRG